MYIFGTNWLILSENSYSVKSFLLIRMVSEKNAKKKNLSGYFYKLSYKFL